MDKEVCKNTCPTANDGVCQEGRRHKSKREVITADEDQHEQYRVECDLGTDCGDCGPWRFTGPKEAQEWTPVADLLEKKVC